MHWVKGTNSSIFFVLFRVDILLKMSVWLVVMVYLVSYDSSANSSVLRRFTYIIIFHYHCMYQQILSLLFFDSVAFVCNNWLIEVLNLCSYPIQDWWFLTRCDRAKLPLIACGRFTSLYDHRKYLLIQCFELAF